METVVSKWGNSLALRLPKEISSTLDIINGSRVNIRVRKSKIEISLVEKESFTLDSLLSGINEDNLHKEISTGSSLGNESW